MKILFSSIIIIVSLFASSPAWGQMYKITVNVTGLHSYKGKVYVELFNNESGYPTDHEKAFKQTIASIKNGVSTVVFDSIPAGDYAVGCYHDENDNGKLDVNFLGIPSEGVGASNNAKG